MEIVAWEKKEVQGGKTGCGARSTVTVGSLGATSALTRSGGTLMVQGKLGNKVVKWQRSDKYSSRIPYRGT